ncbi:MAG: dihydroorotase [Clostridia bacterium]|nr:dihydroorotase [Clostridia bacterium]
MALLIRGGRLIDPATGRDGRFDVLVEGGRVAAVAPDLSGRLPAEGDGVEVFDARGLVVTPGLIDVHTHLRVPGQAHKETLATGTAAAAAGGFTQVCTLPNTHPVIDSPWLVEAVLARAREDAVVRVHVVGALTKGQEGRELAPLDAMARAGAVAFSDDGRPVADAGVLRRAMEYARAIGLPILDHAEDPGLTGRGVMHEGPVSLALGLPGIPAASEVVAVQRDVTLAAFTGARLHVMHLSTAGAVEAVRRAKEAGAPVTAEVTPHHLALTVAEVERLRYDASTKVNPPLRDESDRQALVQGLRDGVIDLIATDHAPHSGDEKALPYVDAPFGISGLETAFALAYGALVESGALTLPELVRRMTAEPARALGLPGGSLREGDPADIAVFDVDAEWIVDPAAFRSKGKNTPLAGRRVRGRCVATFVAGRRVWGERP